MARSLMSELLRIVLYLYTHFQAMSFMFKVDEFCPLCFHIIHVLSFRPNPVNFFS
ncbi:hypothetical protein Hanom_Chr14g01335891 [Helianthus anomalus]